MPRTNLAGMFPFRDHNPSESRPYVTWALIAINILVFLSHAGLPAGSRALADVYFTWGIVPARLGTEAGYETLITSMFLHGGFMHLAGNMLFLWVFGDNLEDALGRFWFFAFYIASGLGAAILQVATDPTSSVPIVGASGAIAGVMGGYLLLYPKARVDILIFLIIIIRVIPVPAWTMLVIWFGMQLFGGLSAQSGGGGIAYWAHAGGFIVGLILCLPVWLRRGAAESWAKSDGHPPHPEAPLPFTRSRIPRVSRRQQQSQRPRGPWS